MNFHKLKFSIFIIIFTYFATHALAYLYTPTGVSCSSSEPFWQSPSVSKRFFDTLRPAATLRRGGLFLSAALIHRIRNCQRSTPQSRYRPTAPHRSRKGKASMNPTKRMWGSKFPVRLRSRNFDRCNAPASGMPASVKLLRR